MENNIPVLVFDLDDTLYSKEQVFLDTLKHCFPGFQGDSSVYIVYQEKSEEAFELFSNGKITLEQNHLMRVQHTLESLGLDASPTSVRNFKESYQYTMDHIKLSEDWQNFFNSVKDQVHLVLLTNGPTSHQSKKVNSLKLSQWFHPSAIYISEETGFVKPNREAFENVQKAFPSTPTNLFWMIGDDTLNDIFGAKQVSWNTIHLKFDENQTSNLPNSLSTPSQLLKKLINEGVVNL